LRFGEPVDILPSDPWPREEAPAGADRKAFAARFLLPYVRLLSKVVIPFPAQPLLQEAELVAITRPAY
jgi:hypothetical protein